MNKNVFAWVLGGGLLLACTSAKPPDQANGSGGNGGSSGGGGDCSTPTCPVTTDVSNAEPVSFRDVLFADGTGMFRKTCGGAACHSGNPPNTEPAGGLYLGPPARETGKQDDNTEKERVRTELAKQALLLPSMKIVEPGDPENSFLMLKMDGCQASHPAASSCLPSEDGVPCGEVMPFATDPLCSAERDLVRAWIAQGADIDG
jgi:hypothetical protein